MQHTAEFASLSWQPLQPVAFSLQALDVYMLSHQILISILTCSAGYADLSVNKSEVRAG